MPKLRVDLKLETDYSYDILIDKGQVAAKLDEYSEQGAVFMADSNVYRLYPQLFEGRDVFIYEASEDNKSFASVLAILEFFSEKSLRRDSLFVVVGGGIAGDIGGFAASMYMRGIKFVQVPTTVLSMVDSSVGGKTAVNFRNAKNNVGAFYQPCEVVIDIEMLDTLTDEEYLNGVAEIIKYGAIFDKEFLEYLHVNKDKIIARDAETMLYVIRKCCEFKAEVVRQDEKEAGLRMLLNFGHTFAHAIESDSAYSIKHGYAVAIGMYQETDFAEKAGIAVKGTAEKMEKVLLDFGFDTKYDIKNEAVFFKALKADKKADKSGITLALTPDIGSGKIVKGVLSEEVRKYFMP